MKWFATFAVICFMLSVSASTVCADEEVNGPPRYVPGDMNGDGDVDKQDIAGFILAVLNPGLFLGGNPDAADVNQDCEVNLADVPPFMRMINW